MKGAAMVGTSEAARRLGCSTDTVLRMAQRGELPAVMVGNRYKFKPNDIEAYLEAGKISGLDWAFNRPPAQK